MNNPVLTCSDDKRRQTVRDRGLNGIDFIEVIEGSGQRQLCVHLFGDVPDDLRPANIRIEGGERIRDIQVVDVKPHLLPDPEHVDCLRVTLDKSGDFSCYRLCVYEEKTDSDIPDRPLAGFDPRYACSTFSFKVDCPSDLDCKHKDACPPFLDVEPEINYLAKDYASFRQLILDRLALLTPDWRERHVPDIGIALVEVLAYAGDHLSYYQDAVATEAYLDTARERISVRRHARLVDYFLHEGGNARAWISVECDGAQDFDPRKFFFVTTCSEFSKIGPDRAMSEQSLDDLKIEPGRYEVFEPLVENPEERIRFYTEHNKIRFYTWGDAECCLPIGATSATLLDKFIEPPVSQQNPYRQQQNEEYLKRPEDREPERALRHLRVGDILIFEEVLGPKTGSRADADPTRRWAVRLTAIAPCEDPLTNTPVVEIEWSREDALPFPLCLSALLPAPDCTLKEDISVALGNVILVDHGRTICERIDDVVPTDETIGECVCEDAAVEFTYIPGKFRPTLRNSPVTFSQGVSYTTPASTRLTQDPSDALPAVTLYGVPSDPPHTGLESDASEPKQTETQDASAASHPAEQAPAESHETSADIDPCERMEHEWCWYPRRDLLGSDADDRNFVVEIDNEGLAHVRFGDGECGRMPDAGMAFTATYRIGNGTVGNVAADTIKYMITRNVVSGAGIRPRNPLPARGGRQAEPIAEAKLFAPGAFRKKLERAITADDYAQIAGRNPKVQRAAARLRWTGSWYDARVAIDPLTAGSLSAQLRKESKSSLHRYRRIGHDLSVKGARYVPLHIELDVCVISHYLRGQVESALRDVFSDRAFGNGRRGFFHPDNLTFGDGIYLSSLVAAAQAVDGVRSVSVTKLQRLFENANDEIANGLLPLAGHEIAQLENDPNFPERGKLIFTLNGGR